MPVTKSAKRALRKDRKRTLINRLIKKRFKKAIKTFKKEATPENYRLVTSFLDRAAKKHVIHKNKAARLKSRLAKILKKTGAKTQKSPAKTVSQSKKKPKRTIKN